MSLFLGVDGGQSSTIALLAREDGRVVGSGKSGPCYEPDAVSESVRQACATAGVESVFTAVCCGLSGAYGSNTTFQTDHLKIVTDGEIALTGAFLGEPGIIVIAGTGSIAFGRNAAGAMRRAGGWGYVFGDEGGAFDIVRHAARAALRLEEGWGPPTSLHAILIRATKAADANEMVHRFYSGDWPRARTAKLSILVDEAAESGDLVARAVLDQAAQSLSLLASCVREEQTRVSYTGGVFRSRMLFERFRDLIELSGCECVPPAHNPAAGALLEAFQLAGLPVTLSGIPDMK
jgi:N-acetylglucosamine kinase-like BadF-type ATPase